MTARPTPFPIEATDNTGLPAPVSGPLSAPAEDAATARRRWAYADMKQRLERQPLLNDWIAIEQDRAVGILEQGRFETRFTALLDLHGAGHAAPVGLVVHADTPSASATPGWRARSLAFDRTAVLVSSAALFAAVGQTSLLVSLDRMTRALHAINFFAADLPGLLFLPVHERLLNSVRHDHGKYFAAVLDALGLDASRVVIEIPRACAAQASFLGYLVRSYRGHGFRVAVDVASPDDILAAAPPDMPDFVITELAGTADEIRAEEARIPGWIGSLEPNGAPDAAPPAAEAPQRAGCQLIVDGVENAAAFARLRQHALRYAFAPAAR